MAKNKITKKDMFCKVKIKLENKEVVLNTMIDTGNMLKEPITGKSVIVVERSSLYELIPKEILNNIENILEGNFEKISEEIKNQYIPKLKIIPFSSLGKDSGMIIGIKPEKVEIINDEEISEERQDMIVGIYNKSLTKRGEYNALIGIN